MFDRKFDKESLISFKPALALTCLSSLSRGPVVPFALQKRGPSAAPFGTLRITRSHWVDIHVHEVA